MKSYKRKKERNYFLSLIYKIGRYLPLSSIIKFKLFSSLEWIFWRMSFETSSKLYKISTFPLHINTINFFKQFIRNEDTILDIGCASGEKTMMLSKYCNQITGIDYDIKLIKEAKNFKNIGKINFIHDEVYNYLNTNKIKFKIISCFHILEHLEDCKIFLSNLKKHCSKIFIEVPDFDSNFLNEIKKQMNTEPNYTDSDHIHEFDRDYLENIFYECGYQIENSEYRHGMLRYVLIVNKC
jgi:glycine/sarcosine N-methyltransferase